MNVRTIRGQEKRSLRIADQPWPGPTRVLDMDEHREIVHLYRTRQASAVELARRFGVSRRTVFRYVRTYPERTGLDDAARRVLVEGRRMGLELTRDDALRLAGAAMTAPLRQTA